MDDLFTLREKYRRELENAIQRFSTDGEELARCDREYKIIVAKKTLEYRTTGIQISLIERLVNGDKAVTEAKFNKDVAEVHYKTSEHMINNAKLQLRLIEAQMQREWSIE